MVASFAIRILLARHACLAKNGILLWESVRIFAHKDNIGARSHRPVNPAFRIAYLAIMLASV